MLVISRPTRPALMVIDASLTQQTYATSSVRPGRRRRDVRRSRRGARGGPYHGARAGCLRLFAATSVTSAVPSTQATGTNRGTNRGGAVRPVNGSGVLVVS